MATSERAPVPGSTMNPTTAAALYRPLNHAKSEIRVIRIPHCEDQSFQLETVSLDDNPAFIAFSYVWGDEKIRDNITLNNQAFSVTVSLKAALDRTRRMYALPQSIDKCRYYWADAVCINQKDPDERSKQVQLMRRIYLSAGMVISWVGPSDQSIAFKAIQTIADEMRRVVGSRPRDEKEILPLDRLRNYPELCEETGDKVPGRLRNVAWSAISQFTMDKYWTRVWIFQEVVLARYMCFFSPGHSWLKWEDLELASRGLRLLRMKISEEALERPSFVSADVWRAITTQMVHWTRIDRLSEARRKMTRPDGTKDMNAAWLMTFSATHLEAKDPKDYIYGLLGVTELPIVPDYKATKSVADVYTEYVTGWIQARRSRPSYDTKEISLRFLAYGGAGLFGHSETLPTWAPNFPGNSRKGIATLRVVAGDADRGVFGDDAAKYPYIRDSTKSLFVWGLDIDSVISQTPVPKLHTVRDGHLLQYVLGFSSRHTQYISGISPIQAFSKLMNQDDSTTVSKAKVLQDLSFLAFLTQPVPQITPEERDEALRSLGFSLEPTAFNNHFWNSFYPGVDPSVIGLDRSLRELFRNWRQGPLGDVWDRMGLDWVRAERGWHFIETEQGYLGMAPSGTSPGDILCVLKGSGVPVLLRKVPEGHYVVVGTVRIVGLMNGEAAGLQLSPREFELR